MWQRLGWRELSFLWSRMAQKYYEYTHYKERDEQGPQQRPPRGSHAPYLLVFQAIFYSFFHVSVTCGALRGGGSSLRTQTLEPIPVF